MIIMDTTALNGLILFYKLSLSAVLRELHPLLARSEEASCLTAVLATEIQFKIILRSFLFSWAVSNSVIAGPWEGGCHSEGSKKTLEVLIK